VGVNMSEKQSDLLKKMRDDHLKYRDRLLKLRDSGVTMSSYPGVDTIDDFINREDGAANNLKKCIIKLQLLGL
jgi:hypothetical protein